VEDCHVCCQPIGLNVSVDDEGEPSIEARHEDEEPTLSRKPYKAP
jgi:hypothetical protein